MVRQKSKPSEVMQEEIRNVLLEKNCWREDLISEIPTAWQKYGDLVLFNGDKYFKSTPWNLESVWSCICKILKVNRIALKYKISPDDFRTPRVKLVWGKGTWVEHKDNGITYCWDIEKNMFCAGNAPERLRVSKLKCNGEVVVDLYAGIGYFTLPFLLYTNAKIVHACEWNPNAVKALKINLDKNKLADKCIIHEGDCRQVAPLFEADRVNLGLLPSSQPGWETACNALNRKTGGILHIHDNVVSAIQHRYYSCNEQSSSREYCKCDICYEIIDKLPVCLKDFFSDTNSKLKGFSFVSQKTLQFFENNIMWKRIEWKFWALHVCHTIWKFLQHDQQPWHITTLNIHYVKSYAPHIDHLVLDLKCSPQT